MRGWLVWIVTSERARPDSFTPSAEMPAGAQAQTCARCHTPGRAVGDRIRTIHEYADDEANAETTTVLQMHVSRTPSSPKAIHWHANPAITVEYIATDVERQTIPYVRVTDANGQVKEFVAPDTPEQQIRAGQRQRMDCIDCHNTVGHPFSPSLKAPWIARSRLRASAAIFRSCGAKVSAS